MDWPANCLYRVKLEAPIMEVIDEAVEESGVRGVLDGADDVTAVPAAAALHRLGIAQVLIVFGASPAKRIPCPVSSGSRCSASGAGRAAVAARRRGC